MRQDFDSSARGILSRSEAAKKFTLKRHKATGLCSEFIDSFWQVQWDQGANIFQEENIPFPSLNLTWEVDASTNNSAREVILTGVWPKNYTRRLEGTGQVFGVKFRPGVMYSLLGKPVSDITAKTVNMRDGVGLLPASFGSALLPAATFEERCTIAEEIFTPLRPVLGDIELAIRNYIEAVEEQPGPQLPELPRVLAILSPRQLQRLFLKHVGVSFKWIHKRARVRQAMDLLGGGEGPTVSLADIAQKLGYYDQAHFSNDFKNLTGKAPLQYVNFETPSP